MIRIASASVTLAVLGCAPPVSTQTVIIGAVIDQQDSNLAPSWSDALNLAFADFNAALDKSGKPYRFDLVLKNQITDGLASAIDVVNNDHALALIASGTEDDVAINALNYDPDPAKRFNVPIICMACSSDSINNPNATDPDPAVADGLHNADHWNFRTQANTTDESSVAAEILGQLGDVNGDGVLKVGVSAADGGFAPGFVKHFTDELATFSPAVPPVVDVFSHPDGVDVSTWDWTTDMHGMLSNTSADGGAADGFADALMDVTDPEMDVALMQAYFQANGTTKFLHTHNYRSVQLTVALGSLIEGQEGVSQVAVEGNESGTTFATELKDATGVVPVYRDATNYDAAALLLLATAKAIETNHLADASKVTGTEIRDAMGTVNDATGKIVRVGPDAFAAGLALIDAGSALNYDGASGPCDFDADGNVVQNIVRWKIENGAFTDVDEFDCVGDPVHCPKK